MIDFSDVGKEGLIIQYEEIVAMTGYNVAKYVKSKHINEKLDAMSNEDIALSYINRTDENPEIWLKKEFDIDCHMDEYLESFHVFQPSWLYSYRMFDAALKEGIKTLILHSNQYSPAIEKFLQSYQMPEVKYTSGDIIPVLESHPNCTFTTSSISNIKKCLSTDVPINVVICDDFMYVGQIIQEEIDKKLRNKGNKYVCFTGILSSGFIG